MMSRAGTTGSISMQARRGKLDVYQLAALLFREADVVSLHCVLVSKCHLCQHQRKRYSRIQGCLDTYWTAYSTGEMTMSSMLKKFSHVCGPAR